MKIIIKPAFNRDTNPIHDKLLLKALDDKLDQLEHAKTVDNIIGLKKLEGYEKHYRIYVVTKKKFYRIGAIIRGNTIWLVRFLPRKTIYKEFP